MNFQFISMLNFLDLKPEAFGLDISDLSLKIIKLKKKGKFLDLACFGEMPVKPGLIEKGEVKNEEEVAKTIKEALTRINGGKLKTKKVIVSLPEEEAFLQVIQVPKMAAEEAKKAVFFEAENYIPLPVEKVYLDSQIIPPIVDHLDHLDVLIAALPKETVDSYLSLVKKAGLEPLALEIESQAISRALVTNEMSREPLLLIDLGATRTSFIVFSGHSLRFTSSRPISGKHLTEIIAQTFKIDLKKAEEIKVTYGIEGNGKGIKILEALTPSLFELVKEIKQCLVYHQTHAAHEHLPPNGKKIARVILCGGGANLRGLSEFLSLQLNLSVELGNPWANILPNHLKEVPRLSYQESLRYTTALGLALRGI